MDYQLQKSLEKHSNGFRTKKNRMKKLKEGFKVIFYNNKLGYVLYCTFDYEDTPGFFIGVVDAIKELDLVRKKHGFRRRTKSIRLRTEYKGKK